MSNGKDAMTPERWSRIKHGKNPFKWKLLSAEIGIALSRPDYDDMEVKWALADLAGAELRQHLASLR